MTEPIQLSSPATVLTTDQFFSRVQSLSPKIAVFDCDGTLWSGDSGSAFMRWTMETGLLSPERTAWLNHRYEGYNRGEVSELAICGEMVQVYAGLPVAELRQAAATFFAERVEPNIFPELASLVSSLHAAGTEVWAVSSTCDWVVEEGVRRFNIPASRVLAACVETEGGLATDHLRDVPTDEGKVASLDRVGVPHPDAVFGNSVHDAAMLAIARTHGGISGAFPVNPSPELLRESAARGWPVFFPASVAPQRDFSDSVSH